MNFIYNYLNTIAELKRTLLSEHIEGKDTKLTVSKNPENNIELYYKDNQPISMVVYTPTGIFYYECKTKENKVKTTTKDKTVHKDVKWSF